MRTAVVFGCSGQIGSAVSLLLARNGWRVHAAVRSGRAVPPDLIAAGVRVIAAADRPLAQILEELPGSVDALIDPLAYDEADARSLLASSADYGALVVLSSASIYVDANGRTLDEASRNGFPDLDGPVGEDHPTVSPGTETYSTCKTAMEQALRGADVPVLILRPCAIHGPYARHPREWWFIKRGRDRRPLIPVAFDARSRFQTTSTAAIASLIALWLESPKRATLNVADSDSPTVAEIAAAVAAATKLDLPLRPFHGPSPDGRTGASPWSVPLPFQISCRRAESLGWRRPDYRTAVREACSWIMEAARTEDWRTAFPAFAGYGHDPFDYAAEDALLARL